MNDFDLLAAWRDGDGDAANTLLERHVALLYRFFAAKVDANAKDLVSDLAQKTLLAAVQARDRVPDGVSFRAYFLGIARNQLLMHIRGRKVTPSLPTPEPPPSPSTAAVVGQRQRLVLRALRRLPLDLQVLLGLYYWEDLAVAEVAAIAEIPAGTVKSRLARARELLRDELLALEDAGDLRDTTLQDVERWARAVELGVRRSG